jgi:hypothetical protein
MASTTKKTGGGSSWKGWGAAATATATATATPAPTTPAATAGATTLLPGWVYIRRNPAARDKPFIKYGPPVINAYLDDCWARELNSQAIFKCRQWRENQLIQYYNESLGDLSPYWYLYGGKQRRWTGGIADVAAAAAAPEASPEVVVLFDE